MVYRWPMVYSKVKNKNNNNKSTLSIVGGFLAIAVGYLIFFQQLITYSLAVVWIVLWVFSTLCTSLSMSAPLPLETPTDQTQLRRRGWGRQGNFDLLNLLFQNTWLRERAPCFAHFVFHYESSSGFSNVELRRRVHLWNSCETFYTPPVIRITVKPLSEYLLCFQAIIGLNNIF